MSELRHFVNRTELLALIKEDHKVDISSTTSTDDLVSILEDIDDFWGFKWCPLTPIKEEMEAYIQETIKKILNCSIKMEGLLKPRREVNNGK